MRSLYISAGHKSSGKTTIAIGLGAALRARGLAVQPFKKGPDFIDSAWLQEATGNPCFNLDPYLTSIAAVTEFFYRHVGKPDIALIEGTKGLHDGVATDGGDSNAAVARAIGSPVVLVMDTRGMTRGVAAVVMGLQKFDPDTQVVGVILNRVAGARHEGKLRRAIEQYTDLTVLGAVSEDPRLQIVQRHIGLTPTHETQGAQQGVKSLGDLIASQVDLDQVLEMSALHRSSVATLVGTVKMSAGAPRLRIGVAKDKAFGFYYPDDVRALESAGVCLLEIDTLNDKTLPEDLDGLWIGGGFPECYLAELDKNQDLRQAIRRAIETDLPVYAECGGLMYLSESITYQGITGQMVGAIKGHAHLLDKPVGRGYISLESTPNMPWPGWLDGSVKGHEFHHAEMRDLSPNQKYAWRVKRGHGVDSNFDGLIYKNVLAGFAHLRDATGTDWTKHFIDFVASKQSNRGAQDLQPTVSSDGL
jgi:cobyrinic acid a,c-diamide synthase